VYTEGNALCRFLAPLVGLAAKWFYLALNRTFNWMAIFVSMVIQVLTQVASGTRRWRHVFKLERKITT